MSNPRWAMASGRITDAEQRLRGLLDDPVIRVPMTRKISRLNRAAASLDAIGDSLLAMESYMNASPRDDGDAYLRIYGTLQALVIQQDAAKNLCHAFGHASIYRQHPDLAAARSARVRIAGHPTKTDRGADGQPLANGASHHLARYSIHGGRLGVLSHDDSGASRMDELDVPDTLQRHAEALTGLLEDLVTVVAKTLRQHKAKFSRSKLAPLIPPELVAAAEHAATEGSLSVETGRAIRRAVGALLGALGNRKQPVDSMAPVRLSVEAVEAALRPGAAMDQALANLAAEMSRLASMAREIDANYEAGSRGT